MGPKCPILIGLYDWRGSATSGLELCSSISASAQWNSPRCVNAAVNCVYATWEELKINIRGLKGRGQLGYDSLKPCYGFRTRTRPGKLWQSPRWKRIKMRALYTTQRWLILSRRLIAALSLLIRPRHHFPILLMWKRNFIGENERGCIY